MNPTELTHADLVAVNRMQKDYTADELPHAMQIRHDVGYLVGLILKLDAEIQKLKREIA